MEYIIVFDPDLRTPSLMENSNEFIETFPSYEAAKAEAESWKKSIGCSYAIYAKCSDEHNTLL